MNLVVPWFRLFFLKNPQTGPDAEPQIRRPFFPSVVVDSLAVVVVTPPPLGEKHPRHPGVPHEDDAEPPLRPFDPSRRGSEAYRRGSRACLRQTQRVLVKRAAVRRRRRRRRRNPAPPFVTTQRRWRRSWW